MEEIEKGFLVIQELKKKRAYLLNMTPPIYTWDKKYQSLFEEIHQELLHTVSEKIHEYQGKTVNKTTEGT
ncbi:carbonic anhydrase [Bacillus pfraonensis]|uniref:carbonic anhydrase n=1 Tax=Bacillus TaxID=1386 RepID=UPI002A534D58|nr:carbonic anhydrase [Bacillus pseudomycoides]